MGDNLPESLVRGYLKNRLSESEKQQFNNLLATDPALRAELERQRAEMAAAELLIAAETRDLFAQFNAEKQAQTTVFFGKNLVWAFAGGLLLVAAIFFFFQKSEKATPENTPKNQEITPSAPVAQSPEPQPSPIVEPAQARPKNQPNSRIALAKRHFQEPNLSNLRSVSDVDNSPLGQAKQAYAARDFQKTLAFLEKTDSTNWQSSTFLAANARFHLGQFAAAAAQFEKLVLKNSRQFRYSAEWGLLLSRLAAGPSHEKAFRKQLDGILANPEHPFFEQAKALNLGLGN